MVKSSIDQPGLRIPVSNTHPLHSGKRPHGCGGRIDTENYWSSAIDHCGRISVIRRVTGPGHILMALDGIGDPASYLQDQHIIQSLKNQLMV